MAANPLLQLLLGSNHEQVQSRLRDRRQRRKVNRAQRRAAKTSSAGGGTSRPWGGQAGPAPQQNGLRPPPAPGGPSEHVPALHTGQHAAAASTMTAPRLGEPVDTSFAANAEEEQLNTADEPWVPVSGLPPEPWWVRIRRGVVVVVALVVTVAGVVSISSTVARWVHPQVPPAAAPAVTDVQISGFAETAATDYLSWDATDKSSRQAALARYAAPGRQIDGWDGTGRQTAETASTVDLSRGAGGAAIATVRVRVTPYAGGPQSAAAAPGPTPGAGPTSAAAPTVTQAGTPGPSRWITLAVPMTHTDGRLAVTASPALVGSPPEEVRPPAVPGVTTGDDAFAKATRPTVSRLLDAYASGDLSYARASGTHFAGLSGEAQRAQLDQWRAQPLAPGADPTRRVGDATVTWQLASGGSLTSSYRVQLQQNDGRWFLAGFTAETQGVSD